MADRLAAVRHKNTAFDRLQQAVIRCELERHRSGAIPATWADRLTELQRAYSLALAACAREQADDNNQWR